MQLGALHRVCFTMGFVEFARLKSVDKCKFRWDQLARVCVHLFFFDLFMTFVRYVPYIAWNDERDWQPYIFRLDQSLSAISVSLGMFQIQI